MGRWNWLFLAAGHFANRGDITKRGDIFEYGIARMFSTAIILPHAPHHRFQTFWPMVEKYLLWSALGSAGLFALLGLIALFTSNKPAMLAAAIVLGISILLTISLLVYAAMPNQQQD
jgi:hypothetical protein